MTFSGVSHFTTSSWWRLPMRLPQAVGVRGSALLTLALFGATEVLFTVGTVATEVGLGHPLLSGRGASLAPSVEDAIWHVGTAFALALPARHRLALWLAPALALGFDVDHLSGVLLPTVTGRTAHDLFFLAFVGLLLWRVQGRSAGLLGTGAIVGHLAVDGGAFPFLGPVSVATFSLPLAVSLAMLPVAAVAFFLSTNPEQELLRPPNLLFLGAVCVAIGAILAFVPGLSTFTLH